MVTRAVSANWPQTQQDKRPITIQLRGEVRLEVGGTRVEGRLPGRLGRALLAFLVLNRHRPVTRDELMGALWPAAVPRDPAATLSTLLSGIRRALGAELLQGRSELRLELPPDAIVDVEVAARALENARAALPADPEQACTAAQTALDIYESPLVPLFDAPWLEEHRRGQEEDRLTALEVFAEAALAIGDDGPAAPSWPRASSWSSRRSANPATRSSMRAHEARGNHAEALQAFERLRVLLRDELGSTPSPALRALHEQVLAAADQEDAEMPGAVASIAKSRPGLQAGLLRTEDRPFVGREQALRVLRRELTAARAERRFVLLAGEPGIGKTSLGAAFAREATRRGAIVLYGRADEEALVPYQPFVDVISHLVLQRAAGRARRELRLRARGARAARARAAPPAPGRAASPPGGLPRPSATGSSRP